MAKKSQKRLVRHERGQSGCMWGLIRMFDFRQRRSTQKLISDRRRGVKYVAAAENALNKPEILIHLDEKRQGKLRAEKSTDIAADVGKPSVKKLMEDEMFYVKGSMQEVKSAEVEPKMSNSDNASHKRKSSKRANRSHAKSFEINIEDPNTTNNILHEKSCLQCSEKQSIINFHLDDMMEDFYRQAHCTGCLEQDQHSDIHDQPNQKNPDFEEKLREAIKIFIRQRLLNAKHGPVNGDIQHSKELKDALKTLRSDEELSQKFLQGPESEMVKYLENLWDVQVEKGKVSKPLVGYAMPALKISDMKQTDEAAQSKQLKFFRRKAKSLEKAPLEGSKVAQSSNKIVILKPESTGSKKPGAEGSLGLSQGCQPLFVNKGLDEKVGSHFSLSEIKRRLMQAMGKEQQERVPDGISKISPCHYRARGEKKNEKAGRASASKDHFFIEKNVKPSIGVAKGEKYKLKEHEISMNQEADNYPKERLTNMYVEAKKHLSEMLTSEPGHADFSNRQVPRALGRILYLPEYNFSPFGSPVRDWGQSVVSSPMRFSASDRFWKQEDNVSHLSCTTLNSENVFHGSDESTCTKKDMEGPSDLNSVNPNEIVRDVEVEKISCSVGDGPTCEGDAAEIVVQDEINTLEMRLGPSDLSMTGDDQNAGLSEVSGLNGYSGSLKHEPDDEIQHLSSLFTSPSPSSTTKMNDDLECSVDVSDRPSPVSVLEPIFTEDIRPTCIKVQRAEFPLQPLRIKFNEHNSLDADLGTHLKANSEDKESVFEYIKAVLEASEVDWDEFYIMSNSSDPLLDPSVSEEVEFFPNPLCNDKQLLFDCLNEVLMEVYMRYFGCPLALSFGKPTVKPAPDMKNAIREVGEGVYWRLLPVPHKLEQIVKNDMTETGSWSDIRCDGETMVIEIAESIYGDLVEETVLNCLQESSEDGNQSIPA